VTVLNLLAVAIAIGLILTLVITEAFGLAAGGLVVPGYMALSLLQPWSFALTVLIALATFVIVRTLAIYIIVFGRRRTALMIVTGYLLGALVNLLIGGGFIIDAAAMASGNGQGGVSAGQPWFFEVSVIGYIIPGLIAVWFDRQGILATLTGLMLTSVLVRLGLVMVMPQALQNYDATQEHQLIEWSRLFMEP
jgi:poly-gamma-glutamate biosynthesis protein PgsC/CapC